MTERKTLELFLKTSQLSKSVQNVRNRTVRCDIENIFSSIKLLGTEESGISKSISFFADAKSKTILSLIDRIGNRYPSVFVKITFLSKNADYNQYDFETFVYEYLGNLKKYNITPNIMNFLISFTCNDFGKVINTLNNGGVDLNMDRINKMLSGYERIYDAKTANFLITEKGRGNKFYGLLTDPRCDMTLQEFKSLIFQVLYTLQELYNVGIRHNDTHLNNVWVNMSSEGASNPERCTYVTPSASILEVRNMTFYSLPTERYLAKLYDFDLAGASDPKNLFLNTWQCPATGACNGTSRAYDPMNFMYGLWSSRDYFKCKNASEFKTFVNELIDESILDTSLFDIVGKFYNADSQKFENFQKCCGFYHGKLCKRSSPSEPCGDVTDLPPTAFNPFPLIIFREFLTPPVSPFPAKPFNSNEEIKQYPFFVSVKIQNKIPAGRLAYKLGKFDTKIKRSAMDIENDVMDTSDV